MQLKTFWFCAGLVVSIVMPVSAQKGGGGGLGVGHVTGPVTGSVNETVRGRGSLDANGTVGGIGHGADHSALNVTQNTQLSERLQTLLPKGENLPAAAAGFENQGQFISAVHVAHNLNIPFDQLKSEMTGKNDLSLGKAIQKLRPDLDGKTAKEAVKLADRQTDRDLQQASSGKKSEKFVGRLSSDTNLMAKVTPLLPPGTTLASAAMGFKNEGQFIATLHVAKNLDIPFADLKDRVTAGESLGKAIHALKPTLDANASESAAAEANEQTQKDGVQISGSISASDNTRASTK